ncbi:MAG: DUF1573 domain-containing protein [Isosphaeraceae bacterium]
MGRIVLCGVAWSAILFGSSSACLAQSDWMTSVFPERAYDFGTVARGSQIRHAFPIVNRTNSEIHIADWRTKCGCTDVKVGARVIPPGTQTTVEATINTTNFQGYKPSGLTLILDRPVFAQIDLNVTCFIRGDIVMSPGQVDFGTLRRSSKLPSASLGLTYAGGRSDWDIVQMKTQSDKVKAVAKETGRTADGQIHWEITATLQPGVANGYFKDQITLITNDSPAQTIPISVLANVQSAVSVTPSIINLGRVRPGETIARTNLLHVRSSSPFSLSKVSATSPELEAQEARPGAAADHVLNLKLKAPAEPGPFHAVLKVETDMKDEPVAQVKVFATVAPQ